MGECPYRERKESAKKTVSGTPRSGVPDTVQKAMCSKGSCEVPDTKKCQTPSNN